MGDKIIEELDKIKEIEKERLLYVKCLLTEPQHLQPETVKQLEIEEYTINSKIEIIEKATHRIKYSILNKEQ